MMLDSTSRSDHKLRAASASSCITNRASGLPSLSRTSALLLCLLSFLTLHSWHCTLQSLQRGGQALHAYAHGPEGAAMCGLVPYASASAVSQLGSHLKKAQLQHGQNGHLNGNDSPAPAASYTYASYNYVPYRHAGSAAGAAADASERLSQYHQYHRSSFPSPSYSRTGTPLVSPHSTGHYVSSAGVKTGYATGGNFGHSGLSTGMHTGYPAGGYSAGTHTGHPAGGYSAGMRGGYPAGGHSAGMHTGYPAGGHSADTSYAAVTYSGSLQVSNNGPSAGTSSNTRYPTHKNAGYSASTHYAGYATGGSPTAYFPPPSVPSSHGRFTPVSSYYNPMPWPPPGTPHMGAMFHSPAGYHRYRSYDRMRAPGYNRQPISSSSYRSSRRKRHRSKSSHSYDSYPDETFKKPSHAYGIRGSGSGPSASPSPSVTPPMVSMLQKAYLKASNTDERDSFGLAVSLDGNRMVVGADYEYSKATGVNGNQTDNSAPFSGAVYVFEG